jgi:deoxyadenosine/deoxycytidine kinase
MVVIAISGNIASGKSTLMKLLEELGYLVYYEDVEKWTYLKGFYDNPHIAVLLQLQILQSRFQQMKAAKINEKPTGEHDVIFIERSTLDSLYVFAKNALAHGNMSEIDYQLLEGFTKDFGVFPDHTIYLELDAEKAFERKQKRDREAEGNLKVDYMEQIDDCYREFARSHPNVHTINTNGYTPQQTLEKVLEIVKWVSLHSILKDWEIGTEKVNVDQL